jgi:hypothetical protein
VHGVALVGGGPGDPGQSPCAAGACWPAPTSLSPTGWPRGC